MPAGKVRARPISPPQFLRQHILRMTTMEFSEALGVSRPVVSNYEERGRLPLAHYARVMQLAKERGKKIKLVWFEKVPWDKGVPRE